MSRKVATPAEFAASLNAKQFRTVGCTRVYNIVARVMVLGFIPAVVGHSVDGKYRTEARIADVIFVG